MFLKSKTADKLLAELPAERKAQSTGDWPTSASQHLRSLGKMDEVWKILAALPSDPDKLVSPDDWWMERRAAAYAALRADKPDIAYAIVREPGPLSVNPLKDATFMAGWLALRYLDDAKAALTHLEASRAAADGPLTQSRADYWLGRTLEALGRQDEARKRYTDAAKLFDTFHGQLARHKIEPRVPDLSANLPATPTAEETSRFNELDAVKAVVIAINSNLDRGIVRMLLGHLRYHLKTEGEVALLAQLAETLGDMQMVVRIGKTAIARGMNLTTYAYPIHPFPAYTALRTPPEKAMLLGIARQESEFNSTIVSTAGARGLLQVMPITARHICRDHNVKCDISRLLTDNSYNAMIASAYIGDRMAEFGGNYLLTLAGYNAGPGRAREWVRAFGDPRITVDPIDWIESIPIEETREYVKKVLANIQVYRARLGRGTSLAPQPGSQAADVRQLKGSSRMIAAAGTRSAEQAAGPDLRSWRDIFYTSRDGLRLFARHYSSASRRRPVVCIPGLTRNSRDFHTLANYLSDPANPYARDVYAVDLRGRGRSARDANWQNYNIQVEMLDVLDLITVAGVRAAGHPRHFTRRADCHAYGDGATRKHRRHGS